ncbi:MAG UNVERIFIED_CONTAM: hypothetical protein LVQ98_01400 [Rickettsiaceae bacterium]|jgi:uncharacterized protein YxeA
MRLDFYKFYHKIKLYFGNNIGIKQYVNIGIILVILFLFIAAFIYITNQDYKKKLPTISKKEESVKIEMASEAIDPEKMWRNYFEDTIESNHGKTNKQLEAIQKSLVQEYDEVKNNNQKEIAELRNELESTRNELKDTLNDLIELQKRS